jgi:hypothetical protein
MMLRKEDFPESVIETFLYRLTFVQLADPDLCWPWPTKPRMPWDPPVNPKLRSGSTNYGKITWGTGGISHSSVLVHRLSFIVFNGPLLPGQVVRHTCDNPPCVNPKHLIAGTHADNMADMVKRGRARNRWMKMEGE